MNIFIERNYRNILKLLIDEKKDKDGRASFQQLAEEIRVPKSYVSKVMNNRADFSADQIFLCARYFALDDHETRYLDLLVEYERSALQSRKDYLLKQIDSIRQPFLNTEKNLKVESAEQLAIDLREYYLNPVNLLVHQCLTIDRYRLTPALIYKDLKIAPEEVQRSIEELLYLGIIKKQGQGYLVVIDDLHLPADHKYYPAWRNQMKLLTSSSFFHTSLERNRSFSAVVTLNTEGRDILLKSFFDFLNSVKSQVQPNPNDEVYQINFDLIQWTETQ